jgi:hypothetical protein
MCARTREGGGQRISGKFCLEAQFWRDIEQEMKMKKRMLVITIVLMGLLMTTSIALADKPVKFDAQGNEIGWEKTMNGCTTIQSGELISSNGDVLTTGFDDWGYNYQAHQYIGYYGNYQRPPQPVDWGYRLMMKWNDAWLANVDCYGDGLLDRHFGFQSYRGSGAWLTNHISGTDTTDDGQICDWNYFVKIVAAPVDATLDKGVWIAADETQIGPAIWGEFAIIQQVENDSCAGLHGVQYISPDHAGFGGW